MWSCSLILQQLLCIIPEMIVLWWWTEWFIYSFTKVYKDMWEPSEKRCYKWQAQFQLFGTPVKNTKHDDLVIASNGARLGHLGIQQYFGGSGCCIEDTPAFAVIFICLSCTVGTMGEHKGDGESWVSAGLEIPGQAWCRLLQCGAETQS